MSPSQRRTRRILRRQQGRLLEGGGTAKKKKTHAFPGPNQCHPRVGKAEEQYNCLPLTVIQEVSRKMGIETATVDVVAMAKQMGVNSDDKLTFMKGLPLPEETKASLAKQWFRPEMPVGWKSDPDMWLNSDDIRKVMEQYEEAFPHFKFLGPFPIDFAAPDPYGGQGKKCLNTEMCELNMRKELLHNKTMIGIIYNTDPHYKGGSHWIANFLDIVKKKCYYFDSYGMKPPKQIYRFMQWLGIQEPKISLAWNGRRFQYSNTECGMYCMYFLDRMIAGEPFLRFCRRSPPDKFMLDMRDWMFST
jgi:hypothetical protein